MRWLIAGLAMAASLALSTEAAADFGDVVFQFSGPAGTPAGLCFDGQFIDVVDATSKMIFSYDPNTGASSGVLILGAGWEPGGLGWDGTYYWMGENATRTIKKIHPLTGVEIDLISAPAPTNQSVWGVAYDGASVWSTNHMSPSAVYEQDPLDGTVLTEFSAPGPEASGLAHDGVSLWVSDTNTDSIYRVSETGTVEAGFPSPGTNPRGLGFDGVYLWNVDGDTRTVYKIDVSQPGVEERTGSRPSTGPALEVHPNPFSSRLTIMITGTSPLDPVAVEVYDLAGRIVFSRTNEATLAWEGVDTTGKKAPSGVYILKATVGGQSLSRTVHLVR